MIKIKSIFSLNSDDIEWTVGWGAEGQEVTKINFLQAGGMSGGIGVSVPFPSYVVHRKNGLGVVLPADKFGATWVEEK